LAIYFKVLKNRLEMILTDKDIENLDNYWHNQLSKTDRLTIENRLKTDADFRQAAEEMRLITEGLEIVRLRKMKARLVGLEATLPAIDLPSPTNWLKIALVALVLALATFAVWYFGMREKPKAKVPDEIIAYFEPYPALGIKMGAEKVSIKEEALRTYGTNDFKQAIPLLQKAFEVGKDSMLLFYRSISLIAMNQPKEAIASLDGLQTSEIVPIESVKWYLALAYIENKQNEKAVPLLKIIANTEGGDKQKAVELLKKIKQ
jgi:tetratricopeptide (TPR) repeat protein